MDDQLSKLQDSAIQAALKSSWTEAIQFNQQIVDMDPKNTDALNRLARAYFEIGDNQLSKKHYEEVLKIDPYNQIAFKCLKRVEALKKNPGRDNSDSTNHQNNYGSDLFIEEPGKTKVVNLLKVAEPQKISLLSPGALVNLVPKNRFIVVTDRYGEYLGALPDDLSHQLLRLIKGGNKYQAVLKTIKINGLSILIKEIFRSARFRNQPSFLDNLNTSSTYPSDHIIVLDDEYGEDNLEASDDES